MANVAKFILLHIALNGSYCKVWQFILLQSSTAIVTKCVSSFYSQMQRWLLRIQSATITRLKSEYLSVTSQLTVESRIDQAENGTTLASSFSPFYIPLLTIDHPLSMICLLVQAFLVCKTARIFKNLQTIFSQKCSCNLTVIREYCLMRVAILWPHETAFSQ